MKEPWCYVPIGVEYNRLCSLIAQHAWHPMFPESDMRRMRRALTQALFRHNQTLLYQDKVAFFELAYAIERRLHATPCEM